MNKPFGVQGEIVDFPFKDSHFSLHNRDGIEIEIKDGILYAGVDDESKLEEAKELAQVYLWSWSLRLNFKVGVNLSHTWKTNMHGSKDHSLVLHDTAKVIDRVLAQTATHQIAIKTTASLATQEIYDSASPANDTLMVNKALRDKTLRNALHYFSEEVVDNDRPLHGVYKAIQEIALHLGAGHEEKGREALAKLVGESKDYVGDTMWTSQTARHSEEWLANNKRISKKVKPFLGEGECKERARKLINAYADSLP